VDVWHAQQEVVDPYRRELKPEGLQLAPEGPRAEVGFPTAYQGFSSELSRIVKISNLSISQKNSTSGFRQKM